MTANVVEIVIQSKDDTASGFGAAKDSAAASADEIAAAQDRVTVAENKLRDAQIQQTDAQLKLEELQQSGTASADEMAAAQDKVAAASLRAVDAQIRLGEADATLAGKEALAGDAGEVQAAKTDKSVAAADAGASGMTHFSGIASLALAGVAYESVKMGMSFQKAMELLVTQAGVPQSHLASLKSGVLSLAGQIGFSPDSLATSLYHVASNMESLGATGPQMLNAVKIAAEGAKVGNADLEDVTNALTATIASGIGGVNNYQQAMGVLNATVGAGDMKMQDLADAMGTGMLASVKGFGLSIKDVGAALATFGDNNIRGAKAGTELRMAVQALAAPVATAGPELAKMGLNAKSLGEDMQKGGLKLAISDLSDRMHKMGLTANQEGQVLTEVFGKKAGVGIQILTGQFDRFMSKYPAMDKGANDFGAAWAKTQQNLSQKLDELKDGFEALLTKIGGELIPVVSALAGFLQRNMGVIQVLAPLVLVLVGAFLVFAGAMKLVKIGMEAWQTATKLAAAAQWLLNAALDANPIGLIVIAIAAVIGALVFLTLKSAAFRDFWKTAWKDIVHAAEDVFDWIKSHWPLLVGILLGPIALAAAEIIQHWNAIYNGAKSMVNDVVSFFKGLPGRILSALGSLGSMMFNAGVHAIESLISGITSMIGSVGNVMGGIASKIAGFIGLSPAKEGPLSGSGAPEIRGQHIAADIAKGMLSGHGAVAAAAQHLAGGAAIGSAGAAGAGAAGAGGGVTIQLQAGGGSGLDQLFMNWLKQTVRVSGGDPRIFNKKVSFL